ncbi:TIGR04282 family arsenosugar biosynthesis glycosyltransferase [Edaphobacter sp. HDX4]|uniref:TIGR04282 family arsenosugar biosynthesis glycosyltransferase n=1 Tax=Edaphobacter sp. HDX4 TaxID=2794064 RepID=UPI002FE510A1
MPYPILDPAMPDASLQSLCALAIMAKAPRPGKVKTRLSPPLTPEQAAAINTCFLRDTTENIANLAAKAECMGVISYTPLGEEHLFEGLLPAGYRLVAQRGDGFGERLLTTAQDLLACGFSSVCLIDSDSPTVPREAFAMAVDALHRPGNRIVLGPSQDGGYYLIGMKQAHKEVFDNITWSTASVFDETVAAIREIGVELVTLPLWYDVDDAATLAILKAELLNDLRPEFTSVRGFSAGHTRSFLEQMDGCA